MRVAAIVARKTNPVRAVQDSFGATRMQGYYTGAGRTSSPPKMVIVSREGCRATLTAMPHLKPEQSTPINLDDASPINSDDARIIRA
jgi:hypothetical protein